MHEEPCWIEVRILEEEEDQGMKRGRRLGNTMSGSWPLHISSCVLLVGVQELEGVQGRELYRVLFLFIILS